MNLVLVYLLKLLFVLRERVGGVDEREVDVVLKKTDRVSIRVSVGVGVRVRVRILKSSQCRVRVRISLKSY